MSTRSVYMPPELESEAERNAYLKGHGHGWDEASKDLSPSDKWNLRIANAASAAAREERRRAEGAFEAGRKAEREDVVTWLRSNYDEGLKVAQAKIAGTEKTHCTLCARIDKHTLTMCSDCRVASTKAKNEAWVALVATLESHIARVTADLRDALSWLRELEFVGGGRESVAYCDECGHGPDKHAEECHLAAFLARLEKP